MHRRLKTILFSFGTAAVVFGVAITIGWQVRNGVVKNVFDQYVVQESLIADQVAGELENELSSVKDKLELAALLPAVQAGTDQAACNAKLAEVFGVLESRLGNLGRINAKGTFACSLNKALIGTQGSKLGSYVTDIFNDPKHEPVLSRVILPPGATHAVAMHVPVRNAKGAFDGTLGGAVYLKDLQDKFLKNVRFAKNGFAFLLDDNGDVLFHPKTEFIGKNLRSPEVSRQLTNVDGLMRAVAEAKAGRQGSVRYSLDGVEKVAAYRPAKVLSNRNWVVLATVPVADASEILQAVGVDQAYWTASGITGVAVWTVALVVVLGTLRAIRLQEKLAVEKAKAQTMLGSIGDGVVAVDATGRIVVFNAAAAEITGWREQEAMGKPWQEVMKLINEHDRHDAGGFVEETLKLGKLHRMPQSTMLVRRDGAEVPVGDSAAPIFDAGGKVAGVIIVFRDLTEEREAARMKSDFAYASHQFRTPLTQAISAISLAQEETDKKMLRDDLGMAMVGLNSAHRLALKILAMADIDNGRVKPVVGEVDLPKLLKDVQKAVSEHVPKEQVFKVTMAPELKTVETDGDLLKQMVSELLYNAADYGDGKLVSLDAELKGGELVVRVRNGGAPISKEDQDQIYTRFFRGSNRPADLPGAGLGLYLVHEYVKQLHGKVWLESTDEATTFWISVPVKRPA